MGMRDLTVAQQRCGCLEGFFLWHSGTRRGSPLCGASTSHNPWACFQMVPVTLIPLAR